jgi:hypothetical protein
LRSVFTVNKLPLSRKFHHIVAAAFLGPKPHPDWQLDHLNRNRQDNRVENLKWKSPEDNAANTGVSKNCKSGVKGLTFQPFQGGRHWCNARWNCKIVRSGVCHLKYFPEDQRPEAEAWLIAKRQELNIPL